MVFDIMRKGKSRGRGSSWLWKGSILVSIVPVLELGKIQAEDSIGSISLESTHHIQQVPVLSKMHQNLRYPMSFVLIAWEFEVEILTRIWLAEDDGKRDWPRTRRVSICLLKRAGAFDHCIDLAVTLAMKILVSNLFLLYYFYYYPINVLLFITDLEPYAF